MMNSAYFRNKAWEQLSHQWGTAVLFTLVYLLISVAVSTAAEVIPFVGAVLSIVVALGLYPMIYSYGVAFLDNLRSGKAINIDSLFVGYKEWSRIVTTYFLTNLYAFLWTLLLIVPGIIKAIEYSQVPFILRDNPELSDNVAIEKSMAMMQGHRWQYFKLQFSFIGWWLLVLVTFGVAILWVQPYVWAACANFYESLKADSDKQIEE
ncbi:MAG: DUF975 family protein [Bacteroidaceae bacterium]|nr:DUF975 family protein [Bacteroidaceae bacterium]